MPRRRRAGCGGCRRAVTRQSNGCRPGERSHLLGRRFEPSSEIAREVLPHFAPEFFDVLGVSYSAESPRTLRKDVLGSVRAAVASAIATSSDCLSGGKVRSFSRMASSILMQGAVEPLLGVRRRRGGVEKSLDAARRSVRYKSVTCSINSTSSARRSISTPISSQ